MHGLAVRLLTLQRPVGEWGYERHALVSDGAIALWRWGEADASWYIASIQDEDIQRLTSDPADLARSVIGGLLVQGPGWQWVFFINVPLGATLATLVLAQVLAEAPRDGRARTDLVGAGTLAAGLSAATLGCTSQPAPAG